VRAAGADGPDRLPALVDSPNGKSVVLAAEEPVKQLPINLDAVFHLAEEQNHQISLARARVEESFAENDLADKAWLPRLEIGTLYTRHEGGIANEDGRLTHSSFGTLFGGLDIYSRLDLREAVIQRVSAQRAVWQQKGELVRVTNETLLDAASTYVDMLAAREGEAIAIKLQKDLEDLQKRTRKLVEVEKGAEVELARVQAQLKSSQATIRGLRESATRASAKLAYLLGIDPSTLLIPVDDNLVPFTLVDASPPVTELVTRALANGPGVREMEGLLNLIHETVDRANGPGKFLPVFEMRLSEGGFGTGPGDSQTRDNSLNLGLQARWNLTELLTACDKQRVLRAKTEQAHAAYQDLRAKLTAGVHESREAILSGQEQIQLGREQIENAQRAHMLSMRRLDNNVPGSSPSEVLLSLQSVSLAQINYLTALRNYDKAQLRLMVLLGTITCKSEECPAPCRSK
jgi:outer membrane protein TolC